MCSAIEVHEALTKSFLPGEGDLLVTQLLSGLACILHVMYKQLGNLHILHRVSALHALHRPDQPNMEVLRKALILSSSILLLQWSRLPLWNSP